MIEIEEYSKYEIARILGARALQIAMNAPLLIKINEEDLEKINFDALKIAEVELNSGILPIAVNKPFPKRKEGELKRIKPNKVNEEKEEIKEEEEIVKDSEIMALANPDEEDDEEVNNE